MSLSLQEQADASAALLYLQELIDAGLITIKGFIDETKAKDKLAELRLLGMTPREDRAESIAFGLAAGPLACRVTKLGELSGLSL